MSNDPSSTPVGLSKLPEDLTYVRHVEISHVSAQCAGKRLDVRFDVGWRQSWRDPEGDSRGNWDAAWIFFKMRTRMTRRVKLTSAHHSAVTDAIAHGDLAKLKSALAAHPDVANQLHGASTSVSTGKDGKPELTVKTRPSSGGAPGPESERIHETLHFATMEQDGPHLLIRKAYRWYPLRVSTLASDHIGSPEVTIVPASDGMGVFVHRSATNVGVGAVSFKAITVRCVVPDTVEAVEVWLMGLEMVYVPEGQFELGEPEPKAQDAPVSCFHRVERAGEGTWPVTSENAIPVLQQEEDPTKLETPKLTWDDADGAGSRDDIPAAYPKGFRAIYCMKRKVTQGEYTDFINSLVGYGRSVTVRYPYGGEGDYRYEIYRAGSHRVALRPLRACNWQSFPDAAAFAWWAGLRPMSELEFTKICRGSLPAVTGEYAWGSAQLDRATIILGTELGTPVSLGNANLGNSQQVFHGGDGGSGPLRDDIFRSNLHSIPNPEDPSTLYQRTRAILREPSDPEILELLPTPSANQRESTGASFWGVMGMSGNLWEYVVTAGNAAGRCYEGHDHHGQGILDDVGNPAVLDANGDILTAKDTTWPGLDGAGVGFRGGSWYTDPTEGRVADRTFATSMRGYVLRSHDSGSRFVRTADSDN